MTLEIDVRVQRGGFDLTARANVNARTTGLFGPSGAGKTTLLFAIAGLLRPEEGIIRLDGETLFDASRGVHMPAHRRGIGIVFQDARLFPHYSVDGNLRYGMSAPRAASRVEFDEVVELLELGVLLGRRVGGLSGGERQRVALGRALLGGPRLLCLDEPLASLDHTRRRQILPFLRRVRDQLETPMLYVSHALGDVLQLTDRLLLIEHGMLVTDGRYRDLALHGDMDWAPDLVNVIEVHRLAGSADAAAFRTAGERTLVGSPALAGNDESLAIAVRPADIALAISRPTKTSIQNQLDGRVTRLSRRGGGALVEVDAGPMLLVSVGEAAVDALGLAPGRDVVCLIKASAIARA